MDADQIRRLQPALTQYLMCFDNCFDRRDTRAYLSTYVLGQLSDLSEKSCEPMALAAGVPPPPYAATGLRQPPGARRGPTAEVFPGAAGSAWVPYHVKNGDKGPLVWDVKHTLITVPGEDGLPGQRWHLVVARNVLDPTEIKFFISNAPEQTCVETLLLVAFSRWRVERCFLDAKQEVGLDQWEGRCWLGLKRHLILTAVSYLFLARVRQQLRGEKSRTHRVPGAPGGRIACAWRMAQPPRLRPTVRADGLCDPALATTQPHGAEVPCSANTPKTPPNRGQTKRSHSLSMAVTLR